MHDCDPQMNKIKTKKNKKPKQEEIFIKPKGKNKKKKNINKKNKKVNKKPRNPAY
jgi:hypothetical protein